MINVGGTKIARLLPNRLVTTKGKETSKTLYLTFDDGPHPTYTDPICDLLNSFSIKASFFCVGNNLDKHPHIAQRLLNDGHLIANHSNTHCNFAVQPLARCLQEANDCQTKLYKFDPECPKIFRAPKGQLSIQLMVSLSIRGWDIVHWSYDSMDYRQGSLNEQLNVFKESQIQGGDVLLFHDDNQLAIELLTILIPEWIEKGYQFDTVQALVNRK